MSKASYLVNMITACFRDIETVFFSRLGELKIGDVLVVETSAGIYTYEITGTRIVSANDRTVIVPTDTGRTNANHLLPLLLHRRCPRSLYSKRLLASETLKQGFFTPILGVRRGVKISLRPSQMMLCGSLLPYKLDAPCPLHPFQC